MMLHISLTSVYKCWDCYLPRGMLLFCIVVVITANEQGSATHYRLSDTDASLKASLARKASNNFTVRLRLYDGKNSITPWTYPHSVVVTKRLFVEMQLRPLRNNMLNANLAPLPRHCYFSTNSDPTADDQHHHIVLESGCSKNDAKIEFYDDDDLKTSPSTHSVRFSILIRSFYFENRHFMFLHCKAAVCSTKAHNSQEVQMCPKERCQAHQSLTSPDAQLFHMFSGPLQPVMAARAGDGSSADIPEWTVNGSRVPAAAAAIAARPGVAETAAAARCPPCLVPDRDGVDSTTHGVDALSVVGIAVVSFMIGVFLMVSLCYIHKITEPSKLAKAKYLQKSFNCHPKSRHAADDRKMTGGGEMTASTCVSFASNAHACQVAPNDSVSLLPSMRPVSSVGPGVDSVTDEEPAESTATLISGAVELSSGCHSSQLL